MPLETEHYMQHFRETVISPREMELKSSVLDI